MQAGTISRISKSIPTAGFRCFEQRDDCDDVDQKSVAVFYRVADKKIDSIRLFSENCAVDAGGLPVTILTGVDPKGSIDYLSTFVNGDTTRLNNRALDAIASRCNCQCGK